jgi:hypothetical protein
MKNASQINKQAKEAEKLKIKEEARVNKKVEDSIFPLLKEISDDVEDAKIIPGVLKTVIQQAIFNNMMKQTIESLDLITQLKGADKESIAKYSKLIELLEDEKISTAYTILDGLVEEITLKERLAMKKLSLSALYEGN